MSDLTISSMESKLTTYIKDKVRSATTWSSESNRGSNYMNTSALASREIGATTPVSSGNLNAAALINRIRSYANAACRWRYVVTGRKVNNSYSSQQYGIAAMTPPYQFPSTALLNYISSNAAQYSLGSGMNASGTQMNNFLASIYNQWYSAVNSAGTIDLRVCHDNCHSNCHSSRSRR